MSYCGYYRERTQCSDTVECYGVMLFCGAVLPTQKAYNKKSNMGGENMKYKEFSVSYVTERNDLTNRKRRYVELTIFDTEIVLAYIRAFLVNKGVV